MIHKEGTSSSKVPALTFYYSLAGVFECAIWFGLHSILLVTRGALAPSVTNRIECNPNQIAHEKDSCQTICHESIQSNMFRLYNLVTYKSERVSAMLFVMEMIVTASLGFNLVK